MPPKQQPPGKRQKIEKINIIPVAYQVRAPTATDNYSELRKIGVPIDDILQLHDIQRYLEDPYMLLEIIDMYNTNVDDLIDAIESNKDFKPFNILFLHNNQRLNKQILNYEQTYEHQFVTSTFEECPKCKQKQSIKLQTISARRGDEGAIYKLQCKACNLIYTQKIS